jgi:hypothetical protein
VNKRERKTGRKKGRVQEIRSEKGGEGEEEER